MSMYMLMAAHVAGSRRRRASAEPWRGLARAALREALSGVDQRFRGPGHPDVRAQRGAAAALQADHRQRHSAGRPTRRDHSERDGCRVGPAAGGAERRAAVVLCDDR